MKLLHRGLAVTKAIDREQSSTILQYVFDEIAKRDADLVDQIEQVDRALWKLTDRRQDLTQQRRWLAEQRQQLIDEAATEHKGG